MFYHKFIKIGKEDSIMKNKINFKDLKGYVFPVVLGVVTIISGINEKRSNDRNLELEKKLDALNEKLGGLK